MRTPGVSGIPTGLVSFVFTDVEGSTRLWDDHHEQMDIALRRHDEILRDVIETHAGHVFSHAGDGYGIAFDTPSVALDAAAAIQQGLEHEEWPPDAIIRVRVGVHIGTSEERDGDYFGTAVNRAARLMSAGHGGQILVSAAAHEAATGHPVIDLGVHRLKDLSAPEHVWQLVVDDLSTSFPPIRTLDETKTSLPVRPVELIGRTDELDHIGALLEEQALVTIYGTGGVGKTTLAIQAAANAVGGDTRGVWLVELAPVKNGHDLPFAILDGMRVATEPGREPLETITEAIGDDRTLLVIDNCEHVREEAAKAIRTIIDACPRVTVLATSREPLVVAGETSLAIDPLPAGTVESPGVTLFVERAREANPGIDLSPASMVDIVELCRRLDGLPLAIELAAARSRSFTPADLVSLLDQRFRVLQARGTARERHATLHDTIAWSFQLLDENERLLFARLSVFAGEFDLAAVEAVCTDGRLDRLDVFDLLDRLVQRSMVVAEVHGPKARFRLLQSLKDFGAEHLEQPEIWRRRHADEHASWMRGVTAELYGPRGDEVLTDLDRGWGDLRLAVAFGREAGDLALLERLITGLPLEMMFRARTEVAEWVRAAVALADEPSLALLAMSVAEASVSGNQDGVFERGAAYLERALVDPDFDPSDGLAVGLAVHLAGEPEITDRLYRLAVERVPAEDVGGVRAWAGSLRGLLYIYTGRVDEAEVVLEETRRLLARRPMCATMVTGFDLIDTLRMADPPDVVIERMQAVSRAATAVRSRLVRDVADMTVAAVTASLGDNGQALLEAADLLDQLGQRESFTNLSQQLRRAAVMLLRAESHQAALLILAFLAHQRAPEPNPALAAELEELVPTARTSVPDVDLAAIEKRAATINHPSLVRETVSAMRSAAAADAAG